MMRNRYNRGKNSAKDVVWIARRAMVRALPLLGMVALAGQGARAGEPAPAPVTLAGGGVEVVVWPALGGRVMSVRRADEDGPNVLQARLDVPPDGDTRSVEGHTVWVAPQAEWYAHQRVDPEKRDACVDWPPDPALDAAVYRIVEQDARKVVLEGPGSAISGLRMRKTVAVDDDGVVRLRAEAVNIRDEPVTWALWSNTRLPAAARGYAPVDADAPVTLSPNLWVDNSRVILPVIRERGWLSVTPTAPPADVDLATVKAAFRPRRPLWVAFVGDYAFEKEAVPPTVPEVTAPGHGAAEIYHMVARPDGPVPGFAVLEIELQGPLRTLAPGESMRWEESWRLVRWRDDVTATPLDFLARRFPGIPSTVR